MKDKLKIAMLFGGCSPEYEGPLPSAYSVIRHMGKSKYTPVSIGITRQGSGHAVTAI